MQSFGEHLSRNLGLLVLNTCLTQLVLAVLSSIWVESQKDLSVLERVLLLDTASLGEGVALWLLQHRLDFAGVDQSVDVCVADEIGW